jgi:leader peptidase (prepilin peptidase)/N-methyltransferase
LLVVIATLALLLTLARLVWIDLHSLRLPDIYTLPLIAAGLAIAPFHEGVTVAASLIGATIGFGLFWAIGEIYFRRHGTEGLGLGDAKLFAASGSWLGYALLPQVLLVASLGGLIFALLAKRDGKRQIAFGPWLALGFALVWLKVMINPGVDAIF